MEPHHLSFGERSLEVRTSCQSSFRVHTLGIFLSSLAYFRWGNAGPARVMCGACGTAGLNHGLLSQGCTSEAWMGRQRFRSWCRPGPVECNGINDAMCWASWHSLIQPSQERRKLRWAQARQWSALGPPGTLACMALSQLSCTTPHPGTSPLALCSSSLARF